MKRREREKSSQTRLFTLARKRWRKILFRKNKNILFAKHIHGGGESARPNRDLTGISSWMEVNVFFFEATEVAELSNEVRSRERLWAARKKYLYEKMKIKPRDDDDDQKLYREIYHVCIWSTQKYRLDARIYCID